MLDSKRSGDVVIVTLREHDRLNAPVAEQVKEELLEYFSKPDMDMVFDLRGINFIDSSGFGVFLNALKAANNNSGRFKICRAGKEVMELFTMLQLHHVFEIYEELDACLESFEQ